MSLLPPLNALKAFDSAARHLSFTLAAVELHVTHGAVSRQVASLEQHLQTTLFVRASRGLILTADGAKLAHTVGVAFEMLRSATVQTGASVSAAALRVSVPPTLAMRWLMPRLSTLHHLHPKLRIELSTSTEPADFGPDAYDAAIRRIANVPKGMVAERFIDGRSIPVCSPSYQAKHRLRAVGDLRGATLVISRTEPSAWTEWLRATKVRRDRTASVLVFDQLYFALQAALDSLGVALIPAALVEPDVRGGRLCVLAEPVRAVSLHYALLSPRISAKRKLIRTFGRWLGRST
jgi:LysR family transcriptional regulator, glycine cleavage system transcriptional activator